MRVRSCRICPLTHIFLHFIHRQECACAQRSFIRALQVLPLVENMRAKYNYDIERPSSIDMQRPLYARHCARCCCVSEHDQCNLSGKT